MVRLEIVHIRKKFTQMVNPGDIAGNADEEEEEGNDCIVTFGAYVTIRLFSISCL